MSALTLTFTHFYNEAADEVEISLPARYEVCSRCNGRGSHDPESWSDGFTESEFSETFPEEEDRDAYFSGAYDVQCTVCNGKRVELVVDREAAERDCPELLKIWDENAKEEAREDAADRATRRMESGGLY